MCVVYILLYMYVRQHHRHEQHAAAAAAASTAPPTSVSSTHALHIAEQRRRGSRTHGMRHCDAGVCSVQCAHGIDVNTVMRECPRHGHIPAERSAVSVFAPPGTHGKPFVC